MFNEASPTNPLSMTGSTNGDMLMFNDLKDPSNFWARNNVFSTQPQNINSNQANNYDVWPYYNHSSTYNSNNINNNNNNQQINQTNTIINSNNLSSSNANSNSSVLNSNSSLNTTNYTTYENCWNRTAADMAAAAASLYSNQHYQNYSNTLANKIHSTNQTNQYNNYFSSEAIGLDSASATAAQSAANNAIGASTSSLHLQGAELNDQAQLTTRSSSNLNNKASTKSLTSIKEESQIGKFLLFF